MGLLSPLAPYLLWIKLAAAAALLGGAAWGVWHAYRTLDAAAYQRGYDARIAEEADSAGATQIESSRREQASADTSRTFHQDLAAALPAVEASTHETETRVRTIYRSVPVHDCLRPAGVLRELEAARQRANAAAGAAPH